MLRIGLGLAVGASLLLTSSSARAQVVRDTVTVPRGADSLALRRDTLRPPKDTVKPPLVSAEAPVLADPTGSQVWTRKDVFSTGALTVQDLLDRIPGVTPIRSGWISQPMIASYMGDPRRVRVYLDGLELQELDPRMNRIWDLTQIPLWALDDIRIERGATEIRVHMRSWRVERTTPFTRTDVYTGDQATNLYRGLFGRRYQHGEILQIAGQQYGTDPGRNIASSDQLSAMGRVGVARRRWSADAFLLRNDRSRGIATSDPDVDTIPGTKSTRSDAYVRFGYGTAEHGVWAQALAAAHKYGYGGEAAADTVADTVRYESQYLLTGGYSRGPWRGSISQRIRVGGRRVKTPSARLGYESQRITVSALADLRGTDSTRRFEASAVARPMSFFFVAGAIGVERPKPVPDSLLLATSSAPANFSRAEVGVRVRELWLSGGVMRRDEVLLDAPRIMIAETPDTFDLAATGTFATIRGRVWKSVYANIQGVQWSDTGSFYRPKYQTRSELYISTQLLDKIPSGNFHMLLSVAHEYRSSSLWPDQSVVGGVTRLPHYRTVSTLLQFRVISAEVFWNVRNMLGERYSQIPGYRQPRISNIYGVRWEFWN